ncbi:hypothetical protein, partial [Planifilum fimeticola]|uniref:hypothetical protein n=1 Tax=Planifilum fimeticola TaxID=201975 RepID=UPI001B80D274
WVRPEHIKTFLRNCFIPNSTKKAVDPSLSTASAPGKGASILTTTARGNGTASGRLAPGKGRTADLL